MKRAVLQALIWTFAVHTVFVSAALFVKDVYWNRPIAADAGRLQRALDLPVLSIAWHVLNRPHRPIWVPGGKASNGLLVDELIVYDAIGWIPYAGIAILVVVWRRRAHRRDEHGI